MQTSSSETAEGKASPGFSSQMFSELAAPLYEEDEQDFLSEDTEPDDEPENPSQEDEMRDDDQADAIYETSSGEDGEPKFASPRFEKSVSENLNSARTAEEGTNFGGATESDTDQAKGEDQPLPNGIKEGNVSGSLPHSLPHSYSANTENKNQEFPDTVNSVKEKEAEIDSASVNWGRQDPEQQKPRSADSSAATRFDRKQPGHEVGATELSDEVLDYLRVKSKPSQVKVPSDALEKEEQDVRKNNKEEADEQEEQQDLRKNNKEEAEEKKEQQDLRKNNKEEADEQEEQQDLRKNNKEEAEEQKEQQDLRKNNKEEADEQEEQQDLRKNTKEEADEQEMKERMEEQETTLRLEKDKRDAEEKTKVLKEQSRNQRLEENGDKEKKKKAMEAQTRKLMLEKEKRVPENNKKAMEEQSRNPKLEKEKRDEEEKNKAIKEKARKVRLDKEKKAAEEKKQRKETEAKQVRIESLKKQLQQIEETEKMEMERLRREEEKEISLKKLSGIERKEEEVNDKVPEDKGTDQEKVNPTQEKGESSEDNEDQEHLKIKGDFDQKMAEEEAALTRRLEMSSEERKNFEKIAEEYRVGKKERQQKERKAKKMSTKHSDDSDLRNVATAVSPSSKVVTSHHQGWYMYNVEC